MKNLPVFDISGLSELKQHDVVVARFAPYLKYHHKLKVPHGHSFYHVVCFTEGSGHHTIDFDQFEVKPWQIYFMVPGQVHNWEFDGLVDGYVMNFSGSFFQSFLLRPDYVEEFTFFRGITKDSVIDIPDELRSKISALFDDMLQLRLNAGTLDMDKLRVLMLQLFFNVAGIHIADVSKGSSSYNVTLLRNFQKLIEKNYTSLKLPKEYAELLFVTPNHLNALCTQMLGISAGELIRNRIMLEAKRLLVNLGLPVAEIAYQLNFNDNSYFTKFFKKLAGLTPEEFRKQMLKSHQHEHITHKQ